MIQMILNNAFNANIEMISDKIIYEFKIKNSLLTIVFGQFDNENENQTKLKKIFDEIKFRNHQKYIKCNNFCKCEIKNNFRQKTRIIKIKIRK